MANLNLDKFAEYMCSIHVGMDYDQYRQQLTAIYGTIDVSPLFQKTMLNDVFKLEQGRIAHFGTHVDNLNAQCAVYSEMAFALAQRSFDTGNGYEIATLMQSEFAELVKSGTVNKALVSETHLDFEYAKGNHNVASMRMAQVIKEGNSSAMTNEEAWRYGGEREKG